MKTIRKIKLILIYSSTLKTRRNLGAGTKLNLNWIKKKLQQLFDQVSQMQVMFYFEIKHNSSSFYLWYAWWYWIFVSKMKVVFSYEEEESKCQQCYLGPKLGKYKKLREKLCPQVNSWGQEKWKGQFSLPYYKAEEKQSIF